MENLEQLAEQFHAIFAGSTRGHGEYTITDTTGTKAKGKAKTVRSPVTLELWQKHLLGKKGLGVIPIQDNSTCVWGVVDVDEYDEQFNLEDLSVKLPSPLVVCRSKSGGAHIFLFAKVPVSAQLMRKKLLLVARAIGRPNAEVFPKQDHIDREDKKHVGNWLNMPYFDAESTLRYCIKSGIELTAEEFVCHAADMALSQQELVSFSMDMVFDEDIDSEFADAPPCIQYLVKNGVPPGTMNNALFSFGVFAKKKFPMQWKEKVYEYNTRFMGPGSYSELVSIVNSLNRKSYIYKCKDQPLVNLCDRDACADIAYGIPLRAADEKERAHCVLEEVETPVTCYLPPDGSYDEPYWVFKINGKRLEVTVDMANSQTLFKRAYTAQLRGIMSIVTNKRWDRLMDELLSTAVEKYQAPDAGPEGQFMSHVEDFCTGKGQARDRDDILNGKPWKEDGRVYFRANDLSRYLDQQRFRAFKSSEIWAALKRRGGRYHNLTLKGKSTYCWSVPAFDEQVEEFDVEDIPNDIDF